MDLLIQMGKELGYEGNVLQEFVKQQQDGERAERHAEREETDKEREIEMDRMAAQDKDRELERDRIAANKELEIANRNLQKVGLRRKKLS